MADEHKHDDDPIDQEQYFAKSDNISSLIEQIYQQLIRMREDDLELTEQLTSLYDGLCSLRQSLTISQTNSNRDISTVPIHIDSPTSITYPTKQRSDSEPNILNNRLRLITIIDDLQ